MGERRHQHDDDRRHRHGIEIALQGRHQGDGRHGEDQHQQKRHLAVVGNQERQRRAIDRAAHRAHEVIDRRLERAADAHLGDDQGGEHGPQRQRQ